MSCFLCGERGGKPFFEARGIPIHANRLAATRQEALAASRGDLLLVLCARCLLVRNDAFDPSRLSYDERYETSLHYSGAFQIYAGDLARHLVENRGVRDADVLEIGCGAGEFLRLLCSLGRNRGFGVDPVHAGLDEALPGGGRLRIVGRPFGGDWEAESADLVVARHVLEHVGDPSSFLSSIRRVLRSGGLAYVEVPNALWTLREGGIFDLVYEHCSYFVLETLDTALGMAGLEPLSTGERFGGQFLGAEARPAAPLRPARAAPPRTDDLSEICARFGALHRSEIGSWRERLRSVRDAGKRAALWGAGSKGVTFLNALPEFADVLLAAVDQNPRKQDRYVPGTGHPIVPPDRLPTEPPDAVILLNPLYRDEIASTLRDLGLAPEILVPTSSPPPPHVR